MVTPSSTSRSRPSIERTNHETPRWRSGSIRSSSEASVTRRFVPACLGDSAGQSLAARVTRVGASSRTSWASNCWTRPPWTRSEIGTPSLRRTTISPKVTISTSCIGRAGAVEAIELAWLRVGPCGWSTRRCIHRVESGTCCRHTIAAGTSWLTEMASSHSSGAGTCTRSRSGCCQGRVQATSLLARRRRSAIARPAVIAVDIDGPTSSSSSHSVPSRNARIGVSAPRYAQGGHGSSGTSSTIWRKRMIAASSPSSASTTSASATRANSAILGLKRIPAASAELARRRASATSPAARATAATMLSSGTWTSGSRRRPCRGGSPAANGQATVGSMSPRNHTACTLTGSATLSVSTSSSVTATRSG